MPFSVRRRLPRVLFGVAASAAPLLLSAQEHAVIDEIVVSARKRIETVQEVPQAVTVFNGEQIELHGIRSLEDLGAFTPGFYFKSVGSFEGRTSSDLRFRGMDVNTSLPWLQLGSVFVDGIYISGGVQNIGFENLERVEISKGPQSAMFGRSTFGGAVNFVTADPDDAPAARLSAIVAQNDERGIEGWVESPLIQDRLSGRVSLRHSETGGQYTNPTDGAALGEQQTLAISSTLLATPTQDLRAKLVLFYAHDEDGLAPLMLVRNDSSNCGPFVSGGRRTFCGELPARLTGVDADLRSFLAGISQTRTGIRMHEAGLEREARRASLDVQLRLGDLTLTALTGASDEDMGTARDADLIPNLQRLHLWQGLETRDVQQELRLASADDGPFEWLLGGNYYDYEYRADTIAPPLAPLLRDRTEIRTVGWFGSATWHLGERYELALEGRYQTDRIDQGAALRAEFSQFLPRATFSYRTNAATTWYASAARGNKPGAFNANVAARPEAERAILEQEYAIKVPIGEETLWSVELGAKHRVAQRGYANAAVYYMNWRDQQTRRALADPRIQNGALFNGFVNGGESDLYGVELEAGWRVTDVWSVSTAYAYARSEYREFASTNFQQVFGRLDASGARLANNPGHTGSLSNVLDWPLRSGWRANAALDALYEGSRFTDETNLSWYGERWRLNAHFALKRGNLQGTLFARNLTDDRTAPSARLVADVQQGGSAWEVLMPERRTFGLRLDYSWGAGGSSHD